MNEMIQFTFRVDKDDLTKFNKMCEDKGFNRSSMLRGLLKEYINDEINNTPQTIDKIVENKVMEILNKKFPT